MRKTISVLIIVLAVFGLARVYYHLTDDFRLSNISYDLPPVPEWETPPATPAEKEKLTKIFDQTFHYIGKGAQVYAFGSRDGKYVLKLFKFKHIRPPFYLKLLPPLQVFDVYREKKKAEKLAKVKSIFKGYKVAFDHDKDNTALIYLHLNKVPELNISTHIVDKIGRDYNLNLNDTVFVLQEWGVTLRNQLTTDLEADNLPAAKAHIRSILTMYLQEYSRGLYDRDHGVPQNSGFLGDRPFHLDVGKFSYSPEYSEPAFYERDLAWVSLMIRSWILTKFPHYVKPLTEDMDSFLTKEYGRPVDLAKLQPTLQGGKKPPLSP